MEIEAFIEARLRQLEEGIRYNQMNINGIDINRQIRHDVQATRKLLEIAFRLRANDPEGAWGGIPYVDEIHSAIACRWQDHKDFKREWLSHG